jgi:hypothetical protein
MAFSFICEDAAMEVVVSNGEAVQSSGADTETSISRAGIAAAMADVITATENLVETIIDSVLQPARGLTSASAATVPSSNPSEEDGQTRQQRNEDQEMEHAPVEVRAGVSEAPDFSELTTGLLSSLSEILPSVTAAQMALSGVSQGTESESCPEASYESSYPNSASSVDSTQLGSMLAQSCNTVTPAPTSLYSRDDGEDGDEARSPLQGPVSVAREHAEVGYDSDSSYLNPACGPPPPLIALYSGDDAEDCDEARSPLQAPVSVAREHAEVSYDSDSLYLNPARGPPPPLIPLEEVVNMDVTEAADDDDDEEEEEEEDEDVPDTYSLRGASQTLLESIRRTGHAPRNLQEAVDLFGFESTGRLINEMEGASDVSGLGMVRELEDVQAPVPNGVQHPVNGSEPLDLEAAASWLRSQVEAPVSQNERQDDVREQSSHLTSHSEENQPQDDSSHRLASAFENR